MLPADGVAYRIVLQQYDSKLNRLRDGFFVQQQSPVDLNWEAVKECNSELEALACALYLRSKNTNQHVPIYDPSGIGYLKLDR